jgi:sugar lactone lactonase YvrE
VRRLVLLVAALAALSAPGAFAAGPSFPSLIALPNGFQPEGIAAGTGTTFYVGSIPTGAVYRGDVRTGRGAVLVQPAAGRSAIGLKHHNGRLFVAGGQTGKGFVYDARSGELVREARLARGSGGTFINDVVVTPRGAWFTDSMRPVLYRLPVAGSAAPQTLRLSGDYEHVEGFNLNGIAATPDGRTLIVVQSGTGKLFSVDARSGATRLIDLGAENVTNGDGILLQGRTLYVVQNQANRIAVLRLAANLASGTVQRRLADSDLDVPTTVARQGKRLYAVNARFGTKPTQDTEYDVVRVG